jgi:uncharacterized protein (TIGR02118 family)
MEKGMIKIIVLYPNGEGKTFDMDYYCNEHVQLITELLGDAVKGASIEKGLSGGEPGSPPPYVAVGNLYFESLESFENSFGANAEAILGDVPNFTNIEPVALISEVMV